MRVSNGLGAGAGHLHQFGAGDLKGLERAFGAGLWYGLARVF